MRNIMEIKSRIKWILICALSVIMLTAGCVTVSFAADGDENTSLQLDEHSESHEAQGFAHGVQIYDGDDHTAIEGQCLWMNDGLSEACWYHNSPTIYLYVEDAEYDGQSHGGTFKWSEGYGGVKYSGVPPWAAAPGVTLESSGYDGYTISGEHYVDSEAPTLPGDYTANALIKFKYLEKEDYQIVSPEYTVKPKELTLNWGEDTDFSYDGQAHAPTVEIASGQIIGDDVVSVTRTAETEPGEHTAVAELSGKDSWKYSIAKDSASKDYIIADSYDVKFDANVPKDASTKKLITGEMPNEHFEYNESKALTENAYDLPGYEFKGWNTEPDRSGTHYDNKEVVEKLVKDGRMVTLYAEWDAKQYKIIFKASTADDAITHTQMAVFDTQGTLDKYDPDDAENWWSMPSNKAFHGWDRRIGSLQSFYADGASFLNICTMSADGAPEMDDFGNIRGTYLVADYINEGQIVATVTLDGELPAINTISFADCFSMEQNGTTFKLPMELNARKYVFNPNVVDPSTGITPPQFDEGDYDLVLDPGKTDPSDPLYKFARSSVSIHYGVAYAISVVFDYYTLTIEPDPAYADLHSVSVNGGKIIPNASGVPDTTKTVVAPGGGVLEIETNVDPGYHFDGYTALGIQPGWDPDHPDAAKQAITVNGAASIMAHIEANVYTVKYAANSNLRVTGKMENQNMVYGEPQNLFANNFKCDYATFKGWNTKPDGSGTSYKNGQSVQNLTTENNGEVTLYAQWEMNKYSIETNSSYGRIIVYSAARYGDTVDVRVLPDSGYSLKSLRYLQEGSKTSVDITRKKSFIMPAANVTVIAEFRKNVSGNDPAHDKTVSGTLLAKMTSSSGRSLAISWTKVKGAEGYDIFFAKCNSKNKKQTAKIVRSIKGNKTFQWTNKKLKKKTAYKAVVKAWVMKDGKKTYVRTSPMVHAYTSGGKGKYTNAKKVTVNKSNVTLKKGKSFKIKAKVKKLKRGKKLMTKGHAPKLRYLSSNAKIATVSSAGKITAKGKGTCTVYVYAVNGVSKTITVTVE